MNKNLNSKSKTAVIWNISGTIVKQISFLFVTIVLKRLLTPEEFGIVGLSMVFVFISEIFIDAGFTAGLIQQKKVNPVAYSTIFYFNLFISLIFSFLIIIFAPTIAIFFENPIIEDILYFLALIPPISALGKVQFAMLTRELNFKSLTLRDLISTFIGGIFGVIAAFSDYGVYSLVIQQITMVLISTILLWFSTKWIPRREFSISELKILFSFSSYVFLDSLATRIALKIDTIFVGKVFSPSILGFYSNAETLKSQVEAYTTNSVSNVIFPVLSNLQDNDEQFNITYFKAINIVTGLIILIIGPVCFLSYFIITTLFGEKWLPSVAIFQILILSSITAPHINMMARAILARGFSKLKFKVGLIQRVIRLLPISIGLFYGIIEFTIAVVVASFLVFIMLAFVLQNRLKISFTQNVINFIVPNIVLIPFLIVNFYCNDLVNHWLLAISFIILHLLYIKVIKHDSYIFIENNIIHLYNVRFKR